MYHSPIYPLRMGANGSKKTGYIAFRVTEATMQKFSQKHPENTTKSMILRELLRMYLDNEIRIHKTL